MRKAAFTIILAMLGAIAVFHFADPFDRSPSEIATASPNKTYRVYMQDRATEGFEHIVNFNVTKNEKPIIENEIFYSDSNRFIYSELKYSWAAENVLRFGELDSSVKPDEISIINQTNKIIRYLKVNAGNSFLLLELQPRTTTRLFDRPQTNKTADISWVGGFGKFDDGRSFSNWGKNFRIKGKYTSPAHYCVLIKDGEIVVQSREFEGFSTDKSGKIVEAPEANNTFCQ